MSKFYANKFLILFSLIFFSSVYPEDQQTNLPEAPQTAIIALIKSLYKKADLTEITELPAWQAAEIKKTTKKIIEKNPKLYHSLISDLERMFTLSEDNSPSLEERVTRIFDYESLKVFTDNLSERMIALILPLILTKIFLIISNDGIQRLNLLYHWLSFVSPLIQSAIITIFFRMQRKPLGSSLNSYTPAIPEQILLGSVLHTLFANYDNQKFYENAMKGHTLASWIVLPFILSSAIEQGKLNLKKDQAQQIKKT